VRKHERPILLVKMFVESLPQKSCLMAHFRPARVSYGKDGLTPPM
jgi:hypothetical protein